LVQLLLIVVIFIGVVILIYALALPSVTADADSKSTINADGMGEELMKTANDIIEELDHKYEELLFLYDLIDKKQQAEKNPPKLKPSYFDSDNVIQVDTNKTAQQIADEEERNGNLIPVPAEDRFVHPKYYEIKDMLEDGVAIEQIAKQLGIGTGAARLIIELGNRTLDGERRLNSRQPDISNQKRAYAPKHRITPEMQVNNHNERETIATELANNN
jgi:hypothetical protein